MVKSATVLTVFKQRVTYLDDVAQVAVSCQLQALSLCPGFDGGEPLTESGSPVVGAQTWGAGFRAHELIEKPDADVVEELREELDGEGRVDLTTA